MSNASEETTEIPPIIELASLQDIIEDLLNKGGREFEKSVCSALNFLDLRASLTATTEAESDIVAEAYYAEIPYFIVVECQAVHEGSQVGVDKLGQIRGNSPIYLDTRRQQLFQKSYKLIVGKPEFSKHAREKAPPDVGLMAVGSIINLLNLHRMYRFSQDELHGIFNRVGEIRKGDVSRLAVKFLGERQHFRKSTIYSLIYVALLESPYSKLEKRKGWTSLDEVVGETLAYGKLFRIAGLTNDEVISCIRDLDNPFLRVVEMREKQVRLSTLSKSVVENFSPFGKRLVSYINGNLQKLRSLKV